MELELELLGRFDWNERGDSVVVVPVDVELELELRIGVDDASRPGCLLGVQYDDLRARAEPGGRRARDSDHPELVGDPR